MRSGPSTEVKTHLISELLAILLVELLLRGECCRLCEFRAGSYSTWHSPSTISIPHISRKGTSRENRNSGKDS